MLMMVLWKQMGLGTAKCVPVSLKPSTTVSLCSTCQRPTVPYSMRLMNRGQLDILNGRLSQGSLGRKSCTGPNGQ